MVKSLNETLRQYSYEPGVKLFLESVDEELKAQPLIYELKNLYKMVERKNLGLLYRQPLVTLLEIINRADDDARMEAILNELAIYDYVPEIKLFLANLTKSPIERQNLKNSGKGQKVYSLVEKAENGHLVYLSDRWFLISESEIKQVIPDDYIKDENKIREIRMLEQVVNMCEIKDDIINFKIDENLTLGLSTKKTKEIYLNGEKLDKESTLESIFNSPIVPYLKRNHYLLINTAANNLDKFMELDIAMKVNNLLNPHLENYVFNYKDKMYVYSKDQRYGSRFFQYENVSELIHDIQKELDYDCTHFYENKLSKELKHFRALEDKEQQVVLRLKDVNESIELITSDDVLLKESKDLQLTLKNCLAFKKQLLDELNLVRADKVKGRKEMINKN